MEPDSGGLDRMMKRADAALYLAKANGRNRAEVYSDGMPVPAGMVTSALR